MRSDLLSRRTLRIAGEVPQFVVDSIIPNIVTCVNLEAYAFGLPDG